MYSGLQKVKCQTIGPNLLAWILKLLGMSSTKAWLPLIVLIKEYRNVANSLNTFYFNSVMSSWGSNYRAGCIPVLIP